MTTSEERVKILNMIADGKITADEGISLLTALENAQRRATPPSGGISEPRYLRIRIASSHSDRDKVNVNIPINLVDVAMRMGARFAPDLEGVQLTEIMDAVRSGARGKVMDMTDEESGEHVEIYVE